MALAMAARLYRQRPPAIKGRDGRKGQRPPAIKGRDGRQAQNTPRKQAGEWPPNVEGKQWEHTLEGGQASGWASSGARALPVEPGSRQHSHHSPWRC